MASKHHVALVLRPCVRLLATLALVLGGLGSGAAQTVSPAQAGEGPTDSAGAEVRAIPASSSPNYVIGPHDRLRLTVWNQENISGDYTVSADGSFTFPLIGRVVAGGLTLATLETELIRLLAAGYFRNPQVTAAVLEYRSKRVFLMGALRTPGTYSLTADMSLIEALARAGSTTPDAADHVLIIRGTGVDGPVLPDQDASASVTRVDLRQLDGGNLSSELTIRDGDTLYVPRAGTIYVYGQVRTPGSYTIGQDTTVRQALSLAGGISQFGAANRVRILRMVDGSEQELKVELNDFVKPGDTVVVPERFF